MKNARQSGHTVLIIVVIVLALAVLGLLGFLFWKNFLHGATPPASQNVTNFEECKAAEGSILQETYPERCVTRDGKTFTGPSTQVKMLPGTAEYGGRTLTFEYPDTWQNDTEGQVLTSPSGNILLSYTLTPPNGIGGTCADPNDPVTDPIALVNWAAIDGTSEALFVSRATHFLKSDYSADDYYYYEFAAMRNSDEIKKAKAGDSACPVFLFASFVTLDEESGAVLRMQANFKDLDAKASAQSLTLDEIKQAFESDEALQAQAIIESSVLK